MLGLSPREARRRFDEVIDFAELHEFTDLRLKNFSSGMLVRLAFAVMIQVDADVLLIDEVLAVGDAAFQQKCYDEFARLRDRGATVLFVTHDMSAVQRFCDRAMLLERGDMVELGEVQHVANRYLELNFGRQAAPEPEVGGDDAGVERYGDGRARILEAWFEDAEGQRTTVLPTGEPCTEVMRVRFGDDVIDPVFTVSVENPDHAVLVTADRGIFEATGRYGPGDEVEVRFRFLNVLAPDRYLVTPAVMHPGNLEAFDRPVALQTITVIGTRRGAGIVELPFEATVERVPAGAVPSA
jgi:hypothetical protein